MNFETQDIRDFVDEFSDQLIDFIPDPERINPQKGYLTTPNECYFVVDFIENRIIENNGFKEFLGYESEEVTLDLIFNIYHPEDSYFIKRLIKFIMSESLTLTIKENVNIFNVAYRIQKKDSTYKYILSQSFVQVDKNCSKATRVLIKYSDISFIESPKHVKWEVNPDLFDRSKIEKFIYQEYHDLFTEREVEIIKLLGQDKTNSQISNELHISIHTVATHRKHIFKKCNCHSVSDLILFCKKNGILNS